MIRFISFLLPLLVTNDNAHTNTDANTSAITKSRNLLFSNKEQARDQCYIDSNRFESSDEPIWMDLDLDFNVTCTITNEFEYDNNTILNDNNVTTKEVCIFKENARYKSLCEEEHNGKLFIIDNVVDCINYHTDTDTNFFSSSVSSSSSVLSSKEQNESYGSRRLIYYNNNPFCLGRSCNVDQVHEWLNEMIRESVYYSDCIHTINNVSLYDEIFTTSPSSPYWPWSSSSSTNGHKYNIAIWWLYVSYSILACLCFTFFVHLCIYDRKQKRTVHFIPHEVV